MANYTVDVISVPNHESGQELVREYSSTVSTEEYRYLVGKVSQEVNMEHLCWWISAGCYPDERLEVVCHKCGVQVWSQGSYSRLLP